MNPANDSERLVFRELFETLIQLDCRGRVVPGLALDWSPDSSRHTWTFRLRTEAAAANVVAAWRSRPEILAANGIDSVTAADSIHIAVTMENTSDSVPPVLADPGLSVHRSPGSILNRDDRFLIIRPQPSTVAIEFRVEPGTDPRDALDSGADLVVTRDPAVVDYVSARPELRPHVLPWSRTYLLIQPAGSEALPGMIFNDSTYQSLARDAVRTDARPAQGPSWWERAAPCPNRLVTSAPESAPSRIVYPAGDSVAQGVAERIVALLTRERRPRAAALRPVEFTAALARGSERAYVVSAPTRALDPCRQLAAWPANSRIQPLIDTRATAILREGSPPLVVDWAGTLRVEEWRDSP